MSAQDFYIMNVDNIIEKLDSSVKGLSDKEAKSRLEKYGFNELVESKKRTLKDMIIDQFKDFLIILLIVAAAISFIMFAIEVFVYHHSSTEWLDGTVILAILIVNAIIGVKQDYSSEKSLEALKKLAAPKATVIRDNQQMEIWGRELVPGDLVILNTGDKVPADMRIIESINLKIEEAALTGESVPTKKISEELSDPNLPLNERKNMAYSSTIVTYGRGRALVTATGMKTEIGKIAEMIQSAEEKKTPLQGKLEKLGKNLGILIIIICVIVFITGILREIIVLQHLYPTTVLDLFTAAVGLAVAAVPEGLPAIVTVCLSLGVTRMVAKHAIIRKLPAVETLGCASVICSDKTGTLTQNEMTVKKIFLTDKKEIEVTGGGYAPEGDFLVDGNKILLKSSSNLSLLLEIGALCNDASLIKAKEGEKTWKIIGDPTEAALLTDAAKAGLWKEKLEEKYPRIGEVPFDSARKRMGTIHEKNGKILLYIKGAPESVLEISSGYQKNGEVKNITEKDIEDFLKINSNMAQNALRVLAYAYKELDPKIKEYDESIENDLIFVGMSGMIDPPREEVKEALKKAKSAGMKAKMITGDNKETAIAIGKELGFVEGKIIGLTGSELNQMSDDELYEKVEEISIYARTSPEHKVRICNALQRRNHVVAMTGDGVNDAPALKNAEIGVAMGITGTDVSKEASDMILTDDNFATIVAAIEEGRGIYDNIGKFLFYLLSSNTGEILTMFIAILIGFQNPVTGEFILPLSAITILWINLVTDGLPATALSVDPPDPDLMKQPPRNPKEGILPTRNLINMLIVGINMAAGTLLIFFIGLSYGQIISPGLPIEEVARYASTIAFTTLAFFQLFHVFMCRSHLKSFFKLGSSNKSLLIAVAISIVLQLSVIYIPGAYYAFNTIFLTPIDWLLILGVSGTIVPVVESFKFVIRKRMQHS